MAQDSTGDLLPYTDDLLAQPDTLASGELVAPATRGADELRFGLRCGRPLLYPVPADELPPYLRRRAHATGDGYAGAIFTFDLDPPPAGHRYAAAGFAVELADERVIAVQVHGDGGQLGLLEDGDTVQPWSSVAARAADAARDRPGLLHRLGVRTDRPTAWTAGVQSSRFGWNYVDRRSAPVLPRTYGVHVLLELPPGLAELRGTLAVEVELAGFARRRAALRERVPFTVPLPAAPAARAAAVRLCMAADVVNYSGRDNIAAERAQHDLVRVLASARGTAGIAEGDVVPQPQGDGQFTVLPVGIDESAIIPALVDGLGAALAARNAAAAPDDRMRLRFALHRGLVKEADNGWVGRAAIAVHRILDSPPLRGALTRHPDADFVLGVPDVLFTDVISPSGGPPQPAAFDRITVDLPAKNFLENAWLYVAPPVVIR